MRVDVNQCFGGRRRAALQRFRPLAYMHILQLSIYSRELSKVKVWIHTNVNILESISKIDYRAQEIQKGSVKYIFYWTNTFLF